MSDERKLPEFTSHSQRSASRAMEEFDQQRMQERMFRLSVQLAAHSAAAHDAMESSISDGIV